MTTAALTPQERQELNAWIAEHVFGWQWHEASQYLPRRILPPELDPISGPQRLPNYAGDWTYAGPLFDRYEWFLGHHLDEWFVYTSRLDVDHFEIATGITGPEAIAKACKAWEEAKQ